MKRFAVRPLAAALVALACSTLTAPAARAAQVEVLHWWTSGGEAKSVEELKRMLAQQGVTWKDFAVAGGGGDAAMDALHARVDAGHPPTAAQIKGPAIQDWGRKGVLANLDDVAEAGNWDVKLPRVVAEQMKVGGHWAAVPVNVHRVNWLWINRDLLRKVGGVVPETWDQFFALAERFKAAGIIPLAHGDQPWQDLTTFEVVTLGVGGADFYRSVFVRLDPAAWRSPTMARVIDTFRRLKPYTDKGAANRDWNVATAMVIKGQAAYDKGAIDAAVANAEKACAGWADWWGEDTKPGGAVKTEAKLEIWTDKEGFAAAGDAYVKAISAVKASADEASFKAAFPALGKSCQGCHEKFRQAD